MLRCDEHLRSKKSDPGDVKERAGTSNARCLGGPTVGPALLSQETARAVLDCQSTRLSGTRRSENYLDLNTLIDDLPHALNAAHKASGPRFLFST